MANDTETLTKPEECISAFGHRISIRAWLALIVTFTGCLTAIAPLIGFPGVAIPSDFMVMWSMILTYYFSKNQQPVSQPAQQTNNLKVTV